MIRNVWLWIATTLATTFLLTAPAVAQPPPGQTEFVPMNELPPSQQLPAAPLLVTAYAVFLILMVFYVWTLWRRLSKVEAEMHALEQRTSNHAR